MPHVFISYARKDGSDEAERLCNTLTARGIAAWRDTNNLNPYEDFGGEIEAGIDIATHVAVIVTRDVRRADSFVRREIAYALEEHKPIIPLVFPGGRRPITIINHTYIDFSDWERGFAALLERLKRTDVEEITPQTRREHELAYLEMIGQRYDHWRDLYTDLAATAQIEQPKVHIKGGAAARYLDMQHEMFDTISHGPEDDKGKTVTVENFDELREGILKYHRVALIGDPGAGKTTTLERLAYELATAAAESETAPLPLFARLGAYSGGDFGTFLEAQFGELNLRDYLPSKVMLLLDGLNEMPPEHAPVVDGWLRRHTDAAVIVSCRRLDYVGLKLPLQRIDVAPLDVRRIRLFIGNYLEDAERERLFWALGGAQTVEAWAWYQRKVKDTTFDGFWLGEDKPGYDFEPEKRHLLSVRAALREEGKLPGMLGVVSNPFLLFVTVSISPGRVSRPPIAASYSSNLSACSWKSAGTRQRSPAHPGSTSIRSGAGWRCWPTGCNPNMQAPAWMKTAHGRSLRKHCPVRMLTSCSTWRPAPV